MSLSGWWAARGMWCYLPGHTPTVWTLTFTLTLTPNSVSPCVGVLHLVSSPTVFYCIWYSKDITRISYVFHKQYALFYSACAMWEWSVRHIYDHGGAFILHCFTLAPPLPQRGNLFFKAVWAFMFFRKALTRQNVFSYNSVVVKNKWNIWWKQYW